MFNEKFSFHHVGYFVNDIEKSKEIFLRMGFSLRGNVCCDELRKAEICFMEGIGTCVELVSPSVESDLYQLSQKYKNMPYHICYKVPNMLEGISFLQGMGFLLFKGEQFAPAISGAAKVVFLMHRQIGIFELLEENFD